jgi:hypothetical protein
VITRERMRAEPFDKLRTAPVEALQDVPVDKVGAHRRGQGPSSPELVSGE